jgi:hypothetical protein
MPSAGLGFIYGECRTEAARLKAWMAHYAAKGCGEWKAQKVGRERWTRKGGWPPKSV